MQIPPNNNQTTTQSTSSNTVSSNTSNDIKIDVATVERQIKEQLLNDGNYIKFIEAIGSAINKLNM